jgi:signal transduction histidine kinase
VSQADPALRHLEIPPPSPRGGAAIEPTAPDADAAATGTEAGTAAPVAPPAWQRAYAQVSRVVTWSLRRKLIAAIGVCLLPLVLLFAISINQRYADRRALELSANREIAETLAAATETYVRNLDHQLRTMGFALARLDLQQPAVVQAYLALNRLPFADLDQGTPAGGRVRRTPYTDIALLALVDLDGQVIAADPPDILNASLGGEPYVQAAREVSDMDPAVISDLVPAPDGAPPWFAIARPMNRVDGTPIATLVAYVDTNALGRVLPLDRLDRTRGAVVDRQGRLVYDSERPELDWAQRDVSSVVHVRQALQGQFVVTEGFTNPVTGAASMGAAVPVARLGWATTADRTLANALGPIDAAAQREGLILGLVLLFALLVGAFLADTLTRPLRALQVAAGAIGRGDYGGQVPAEGHDEVAELGSRFNEMAARLQSLEEERQAFAAMVAHDLRSPLTAVRGTAQLLQQRMGDDATVQRRLETIVRETDRVARLAADLGDAARAAGGHLELRPIRVELGMLVRDAVERLQAAGAKQPIQLRAAPGPVWVDADPERLAQVLDNLLGNAAKYSPADEPIAVEVEAIRDAQVIVRDCGPGIAPDELPHLFERFYRTHGARRGQQKGSGLGLYISHEIARAHGGDLTADSALGAGSCFTLHLPLAGAPDAAPLSPGLS